MSNTRCRTRAPRSDITKQNIKQSVRDERRSRHGFRGVPPLPDFDLQQLPDGAVLTEFEVAQVLRMSLHTLGAWRRTPGHPLEWFTLAARLVRYRACDVRAFLDASPRRKLKPRHRTAQTVDAAE
jgi:hypothetical protein